LFSARCGTDHCSVREHGRASGRGWARPRRGALDMIGADLCSSISTRCGKPFRAATATSASSPRALRLCKDLGGEGVPVFAREVLWLEPRGREAADRLRCGGLDCSGAGGTSWARSKRTAPRPSAGANWACASASGAFRPAAPFLTCATSHRTSLLSHRGTAQRHRSGEGPRAGRRCRGDGTACSCSRRRRRGGLAPVHRGCLEELRICMFGTGADKVICPRSGAVGLARQTSLRIAAPLRERPA
jgi:hypothetical protein